MPPATPLLLSLDGTSPLHFETRPDPKGHGHGPSHVDDALRTAPEPHRRTAQRACNALHRHTFIQNPAVPRGLPRRCPQRAVRLFLSSVPEGMPCVAGLRLGPASKIVAVPPGVFFSSGSAGADCESCALTTPFETRAPQVWIQDFTVNRTWARLVVRSELLEAGRVVRLSGLGLAPVDEGDACGPSTLAPACLSNASLWRHEGPRWRSRQLRCPYAEHVWEGAVPAEEFQCRFDAAGALTCQASLQVCVGPFRGGVLGGGCPVQGRGGVAGGGGLWIVGEGAKRI